METQLIASLRRCPWIVSANLINPAQVPTNSETTPAPYINLTFTNDAEPPEIVEVIKVCLEDAGYFPERDETPPPPTPCLLRGIFKSSDSRIIVAVALCDDPAVNLMTITLSTPES